MSDIRKKKLSLNKETLLHLTNADLANVVGGVDDTFICRSKELLCLPPKPSGSNLLCPPPKSKGQFRCADPIVTGPVTVPITVPMV